jgi:hypothetical protein
MFYRLSCITDTGEILGYQWKEISQQEYVDIATGTRPLGDAEAQLRDHTDYDTAAQHRTMYYGHVWKYDHGWQTDLSVQDAQALYNESGRERPGA